MEIAKSSHKTELTGRGVTVCVCVRVAGKRETPPVCSVPNPIKS